MQANKGVAMINAGWRRKLMHRDSERGQAIVETAFVLILVLFLSFGIIDFSTLFYVYLTLENGVSQATRYGITGQTMTDPDGNPYNHIDSIKAAMQNATPSLTFTSSNPQYTFEHLVSGAWTAYATGEDAAGGDIVKVTVRYHWNLITPLIHPLFPSGGIDLVVKSTVKNEGFI
jgi:Flp pilus assembly protein TadG